VCTTVRRWRGFVRDLMLCGAARTRGHRTSTRRIIPICNAERAGTQVAKCGNITFEKAAKLRDQIRIVDMKKSICLLAGVALLAACEQKETTVTNPPAEKKESTTVINQSPAAETKQEKTEVNVNTSPSP
jgi:hypothetical protein